MGAVLSARYGIGYWLLFTYFFLPVFLVILRRLLPFRDLLPQQEAAHLMKWQGPALTLVVVSSVVAILTYGVHDLGWFDFTKFPEPALAHRSILNIVILRPVATTENFIGRYILALYFLWAAWTSIHLCSAWRVDYGSASGLLSRLIPLICVCWAYFFGGMVVLMMFANLTGAQDFSQWELALAWSTATFVFCAGVFLARHTNFMYATLLAVVR
jgi:hypothetical protein